MEFFAEMYKAYQTKGNLELSQTKWAKAPYSMNKSRTMWQEFTSHLQQDVKIKVVGVWDTVGSLGLPDTNWITKMTGWNKRHQFHNTRLDPSKPCMVPEALLGGPQLTWNRDRACIPCACTRRTKRKLPTDDVVSRRQQHDDETAPMLVPRYVDI